MSDAAKFRVLVLCAHNRTRSVLAGALLRSYLDERFEVETAGFGPKGQPALPQAVDLLAGRGIDVRGHLSRHVDRDILAAADLVLTAQKSQVLSVVAEFKGHFDRTFTLPEYARRDAHRKRGLEYLQSNVPEVVDPSGSTAASWQESWNLIDEWCRLVAASLRAGD